MKKKIYFYVICLIFIIITIYGGYKIWSFGYEYKIGNEMYDSLEESLELNIEGIENNNNLFPMIDFDLLKNINDDVIGWISIDNLDINYPIVQGSDNDYYLTHLVDGSYNGIGSIFMDYRNSIDLLDRHTIIYGHNMQNGMMFSNLTKYMEQDFYDNNSYYLLVTEDKNYRVNVVAVYVTNINDNSWKLTFENDLEFETWINSAIEKSLIDTGVVVNREDFVITLSTCSYEFDNARFVLVGVLVE